jgi:hypothetical protein
LGKIVGKTHCRQRIRASVEGTPGERFRR